MPREVIGDYGVADELAWAAQTATLAGMGRIRVLRSGIVGALVEMVLARRGNPSAFANVEFAAPFAGVIDQAVGGRHVTGEGYQARTGVFPLSRITPPNADTDLWALWRSRAEQAAVAVGLPSGLAASIVGAMGELQDNVFLHSQRPETGLVVYAATADAFEIVVADSGIGVLASLKQGAGYANVTDGGGALKIAVQDGESRFGRASGHGFGMGQMFRALADHDGELRFRSDDHALTVRGHSPSLQGGVELAQKARLPGLTISVRCLTPKGLLQSA